MTSWKREAGFPPVFFNEANIPAGYYALAGSDGDDRFVFTSKLAGDLHQPPGARRSETSPGDDGFARPGTRRMHPV
jgi:hypothetical protein